MNKIFKTVFGILFVAAFVSMVATRQYYTRARPESPRPDMGWTIPVGVNYGKTVYVTEGEKKVLRVTGEWTFIGLFAVGGVIYWFTKNSKWAQPDRQRTTRGM